MISGYCGKLTFQMTDLETMDGKPRQGCAAVRHQRRR